MAVCGPGGQISRTAAVRVSGETPLLTRALAGVSPHRRGAGLLDSAALRTLVAAPLDVALIVTDLRGRIADMSVAAQAMFGCTVVEMRGRPLGDLCPLGAPALLQAAAAGVAAGPVELVARASDGRRVIARHCVAALRSDGGTIEGYVMAAVDVGPDRAREQRASSLHRVTAALIADGAPAVPRVIAAEVAGLLAAERAGVVSTTGPTPSPLGAFGCRNGTAGEPPAWLAAGAAALPGIAVLGAAPDLPVDGPGTCVEALPPRAVLMPIRDPGGLLGAVWAEGVDVPPAAGDIRALGQIAALGARPLAVAGRAHEEGRHALAAVWRSDRDTRATIRTLIEAARDALGAARVSCYLSADGRVVSDVVTTATDPAVLEVLRGSVGRRREDLPLWHALLAPSPSSLVEVPDVLREPHIPHGLARSLGMGGLYLRRLERSDCPDTAVPEALGMIAVAFAEPRALNARERGVVHSLADLVALTVTEERRGRGEGAGRRAGIVAEERDALTGLLSHSAFHGRLSEAVERLTRDGSEGCLALIDIDRFRRVNEIHGHTAGDRVLREVSRRMAAAADSGDLLGRIGGEELAWFMERPAAEALERVDRVRESIAASEFDEVGQVTISAGLCDLGRAHGRDDLVRLAEGALYWAKQHGRNVALAYAPDVVEALSADERAEHLARSQALQSIRVLARAVDAKDPTTLRHSERVADLAVALGTALGWDAEDLVRLREAGLVHDVGKIGVADSILFKRAHLTATEYREITRHAAIGAEILADVLSVDQVAWVRGHHERWDGGGYPDGLTGDAIPAGARVLALADAWDVMTSPRPYSRPLSVAAALQECRRCSATQFAPETVRALERLVEAGALVRRPGDRPA
jgi:diguanylate cyclase (GGDEF)-like protein/PAS domain S-box-containing protein